ncbi:6381_t:CDS:2, partial [Gigaspora margarita]
QYNKDSDYVVITQLEGPYNELTRLFWITTFSIFVGIDNNFKTRVFAQALTKYKILVDYSWILEYILEALKARSKLHRDIVKKFVADFYHIHNSQSHNQFQLKYNEMLTKYEPDQSYSEKSFIQVIKLINSILKKQLDQGTLLKNLIKVIESELDKESYYNYIKNYYGSNVAIGLLTTYNTIFKDTENVLKDYLFESAPSEILSYITIAQRTKNHAIQELYFINEIRTSNVYIPSIRKKINKRIEFGSTKSVVKTSMQIAIEEGITLELTRLLTQFITIYCCNTRLNIKNIYCSILHLINDQELSMLANNKQQLLSDNVSYNIIEISNPEYYKPRGYPPKCLKLATEKNYSLCKLQSSKTCSYCQKKKNIILEDM